MLKAYAVQDDEGTEIVFAEHNVVARRNGANRLDNEFASVSCHRVPWADKYAPGPVPKLVLIDNGWWFECYRCGRKIDSDKEWWPENDTDPVEKLNPVERGHGIWCSQECYDNDIADQAARKMCDDAAIVELTKKLLETIPGVVIEEEGKHAYCVIKDGKYVSQQCIVHFRFPGCKIGAATFRYDAIGQEPSVCVCSGDMEAWTQWRAVALSAPVFDGPDKDIGPAHWGKSTQGE